MSERKKDKSRPRLTVALAGNPNSGKTTLFNCLTGSRQHVGNYPGVTVEKKEGYRFHRDREFLFVDLPGIYSLTAHARDELVARRFLVAEKPDAVINIVDAANIERSFYLTIQLLELGVPVVLFLNMADIAREKGLVIDVARLEKLLGVPCVLASASRGEGITEILEAVLGVEERREPGIPLSVKLPPELEEVVAGLEHLLQVGRDTAADRGEGAEARAGGGSLLERYPARWLAIKLLEADGEITSLATADRRWPEVEGFLEKARAKLAVFFPEGLESVFAQERYGHISGVCQEAISRREDFHARHDLSDRVDRVLLHRVAGLPIFLFLIWLAFRFVFQLSEPLMEMIEDGQEALSSLVAGLLPEGSAIQSLVSEAIIGGVGAVLVFVPVIFLLFLAVSFLEDSGYMARAAFLMDRLMHKIGLHGRSFIPMMLGFGCNVPAIMAARSIRDEKDRLVTILVNPFVSCGARLPVYVLLIGAFFPAASAGNVLFSIYLLGLLAAIGSAKLFRGTILRGTSEPFVMELPPYRWPTLRGLITHMWERGSLYLKKAGTIIFAGVSVIWFLSNFPWSPPPVEEYRARIEAAAAEGRGEDAAFLEKGKGRARMENSYAARLGRSVSGVFRVQGFDEWRMSVALLGGFVAKEVIVGTLGALYHGDESETGDSLRRALREERGPGGQPRYNPVTAYSLMVFILLYMPCVAVFAVIRRETGTWRWPVFSAAWGLLAAWLVSAGVSVFGRLL